VPIVDPRTGTALEELQEWFSELNRIGKRHVTGWHEFVQVLHTLFGHTRGAFTGTDHPRQGLIASAAAGTIFLDEIGDLAVASQVKLLRLLHDGSFYPLGADRPRQSRARVVVATNADLVQAVGAGRFRKNLYYRLRPPCPSPAFARPEGRYSPSPTAFRATYESWNARLRWGGPPPGRHALAGELQGRDLRQAPARRDRGGAGAPRSHTTGQPLSRSPAPLSEAEDHLIAEALLRADGNQDVADGLLGLSRQALNKRLSRRRERDGPVDPNAGSDAAR
jgi:two-component system nitrogen regulation response regulator GlnG